MEVRRLKLLRKEKELSLTYVSNKLGIAKQSLHSIENSVNDPSYETLCKLEEFYNESHRHLLAQVSIQQKPDGSRADEKKL